VANLRFSLGFSVQVLMLGGFKHASGLEPTKLQIIQFNFPTKQNDFESGVASQQDLRLNHLTC